MTVETMVLGPVSANTYIVTDDVSGETAIVDCGECTPELLDRLKGKNVKYILLVWPGVCITLKSRLPREITSPSPTMISGSIFF